MGEKLEHRRLRGTHHERDAPNGPALAGWLGLGGNQAKALGTGLAVGCVAIGFNYLAHILFALPLLPEQVGVLLLRRLPLFVFSAGVKTLGPLARPMLLVGATLGLILLLGVVALLVERLVPHGQPLVLALSAAVLVVAVLLLGADGGASLNSLVLEVALLTAVMTVGYSAGRTIRHPAATTREDRRWLLRNLFVGAVGLAVVPIGYVDIRRLMTALATKEGSRAATEITPIGDFYVVSKNLAGDPVVDANSWRLILPDGHRLSYEQLLAIPSQQLEVTYECISNEVGGTLISNGIWRGPRVQDLLAETAVPANATYLLIESADGYTESFPLSQLTPDCLLATHLNGQSLPAAHGFPARFVFPGHYGMKQPKWVTRLKLSAQDKRGYWEQVGWDEMAIVKTMSRVDSPVDGSVISAGTVRISGIAFAGVRRIGAVEVSWDQVGWHEAELEPEFSPYSWRFWQLDTQLRTGRYTISVRARDGAGALQTAIPAATLPNGADGLHRIVLDVL